jgi:hypothetical protein
MLAVNEIMAAADQLLEEYAEAGDRASMSYALATELTDDALTQLEYAVAYNDRDDALTHSVAVLYYSTVATTAYANDNSPKNKNNEDVLIAVLKDSNNVLRVAAAKFNYSEQELVETFRAFHSAMLNAVKAAA